MNVMPANPFDLAFVGVSLTQSAIRIVTVDSNRVIKSTVEAPLPRGAFSHGTIDVAQLSEALKVLVATIKLPSPYVVVTLPEYYSYTRSHTLPEMPIDDVTEAISWQLEKILPLPKDSVYFDWKLISKANKELKVLVIAMSRTILDTLIQVFENAGLKPISFEPSASALSRILELPKDTASILVEISPNGSSATLVENQISYLTITNMFDTSSQDGTRTALQKTSEAIQALFNYCMTKNTNPGDIRLLLTGDGASNEVAQWIQSLINRPVELLQIANVPAQFHQAYAAATISLLPQDRSVEVNLLPDVLRKFYDTTRLYQKVWGQFKWSWTIASVSLILSIFGLVMSLTRVRNSSLELQQIETTNSAYTYNSQEIVGINQSSQAIVNLFPTKNTPVAKLESLFSMLNEDISLLSFAYDRSNNQLTISGSATTRKSLLEFIDALNSSDTFGRTELPVSALEKPTDINFNLIISLSNS